MRLSRRIIVIALLFVLFINGLIILLLAEKSLRTVLQFVSLSADVSDLQHENRNVKEAEEMEKHGQKLNGVDIYVIEMDERRGNVQQQAETYKIPGAIHSVPATTPYTQDFRARAHIQRIFEMCAFRAKTTFGETCPCGTKPKEVACTWSHITAVQAACTQDSPQDILLVLEDDANLEPIQHWEESLVELLSILPSDWRIVNAAVTNKNNLEGYERERFRTNAGIKDFGTVAVIYNMRAQDICEKVLGRSPGQIIQNATEPCQPADMFLYDEFKGQRHAYSSHMPLVYFSTNVHMTDKGAIHEHKTEFAIEQRDAWKRWKNITKCRSVKKVTEIQVWKELA